MRLLVSSLVKDTLQVKGDRVYQRPVKADKHNNDPASRGRGGQGDLRLGYRGNNNHR